MDLMRAADLQVGHCLETVTGEESIVSSGSIRGKGLYTVVTTEDYIVVNRVIASPFASNHAIPNTFYKMLNFIAHLFSRSDMMQVFATFVVSFIN